MFCTVAYHQQVKEVFPDPNSNDPDCHSEEAGDWLFWKCHPKNAAFELHSWGC